MVNALSTLLLALTAVRCEANGSVGNAKLHIRHNSKSAEQRELQLFVDEVLLPDAEEANEFGVVPTFGAEDGENSDVSAGEEATGSETAATTITSTTTTNPVPVTPSKPIALTTPDISAAEEPVPSGDSAGNIVEADESEEDNEGDDDDSDSNPLLYGLIAGLVSLIVYLSVAMNCYFFCYVYRKDRDSDSVSKPASTIEHTHLSHDATSELSASYRRPVGEQQNYQQGLNFHQPLAPMQAEPVIDPYQIEFSESEFDDDDVSAMDDASLGAYLHSLEKVDNEMFGQKSNPQLMDIHEDDAYTYAAKSVDTGVDTHTSEWFRSQVQARKLEHKANIEEALSKPVETEEVYTPRPESGFLKTGPPSLAVMQNQPMQTSPRRSSFAYDAEWTNNLKSDIPAIDSYDESPPGGIV